jgi:hypothetical protein
MTEMEGNWQLHIPGGRAYSARLVPYNLLTRQWRNTLISPTAECTSRLLVWISKPTRARLTAAITALRRRRSSSPSFARHNLDFGAGIREGFPPRDGFRRVKEEIYSLDDTTTKMMRCGF